MTTPRQLRWTTAPEDPTSSFRCFDCGEGFILAETGEPEDALICAGCGARLGAYAAFDARRWERRWIITSGRPDQYRP
jgi:hypothetical protein